VDFIAKLAALVWQAIDLTIECFAVPGTTLMTHYAAHRHESGNDSVSRHAKSDACHPLDSPRTTRRTHFVFPKPILAKKTRWR